MTLESTFATAPELVVVPLWAVRHRGPILGDFRASLEVDCQDDGALPRRLVIDRRAMLVHLSAERVTLTTQEFLVLEHLVVNAGVVCGTDELRVVMSEGAGLPAATRIREVVHHLRRTLGLSRCGSLRTVRGRGYAWLPTPSPTTSGRQVCRVTLPRADRPHPGT